MIKTRIHISVFFAAFIACILVLDHTGLAVYVLFCAAVHEAGHLIVIRRLKIPLEEISFKLFGINIKIKDNVFIGYPKEIAVAAAGSAANFLLCIAALVCEKIGFAPYESRMILIFSLIIACFNLLPVGLLDGGRALEALLSLKFSVHAVQRVMNILSFIFIIPIAILGFFLVVKTGYNFSLIIACVYLAVALIFKDSLFSTNKISGGKPR